MTAIASRNEQRPWLRQNGEEPQDHARFLVWAFSHPRPAPRFPKQAHANNWQRRAASIDLRLGAVVMSPAEATRRCAENALIILSHELDYKASMAVNAPGAVGLSELVQLLKLLHELGTTAAVEEDGEWDTSALTEEERLTLARLLAKCRPRE